MHSNWRNCDEWRSERLAMNTTSNEACKLFDVCLSQLVSWKENSQFGGLVSSLSQLASADPDFIMGNCLKMGVELLGANASVNSTLYKEKIAELKSKATKLKSCLTRRELLHVKAIEYLHRGALPDAVDVWEEILIEHPTDLLALKLNHSCYFYMGRAVEMYQSVSRVLPFYKVNVPLSNYLYGMHAFGLAEANRFEQAKTNALKGLELNSNDAWATHALNHCNEYAGNWSRGKDFLLSTENDWSGCNLIAGHNYWHLGLFFLELNEHENVLKILDEKLLKLDSTLDLVNSASLLLRLKLDNFKQLDSLMPRWSKLKSGYLNRIEDHGYLYSDFHMAAILAACGSGDEKKLYFNSLKKYLSSDDLYPEWEEEGSDLMRPKSLIKNYLKRVNAELAERLFEAVFYFEQSEFDKVVNCLYPVRYEIFKMGGSNAQRDIFNQVLILSALQSTNLTNRKLGLNLLNERLLQNPDSDLTKRFSNRFANDF